MAEINSFQRPPKQEFDTSLSQIISHIQTRHHDLSTLPTLPTPSDVQHSISALPSSLPLKGLGTSATTVYLLHTLLPGILQAQNGPRYFGFVIGGVTPAAQLADILVSSYDENSQMTLPGVTSSSAIESRTLEMVLDLLKIPRDCYTGRTITTGATSANVLGLGEC